MPPLNALLDPALRAFTVRFLIARRLAANYEDAEDAVQDALISAWRHRKQFRGKSKLSSWFTKIAINAALMRRRGHTAFISVNALPLEFAGSKPAPISPKDLLLAERLARAICALPPRQRQAVLLHHVAEMSFPSISKVSGKHSNTVKSAAHYGRKKLRQILTEKP